MGIHKLLKVGCVFLIGTWIVFLHHTGVWGAEVADLNTEMLDFDAEGNLMMTTHDKIATGSVTYRTLGWTIKRYNQPIDAPGNESVVIMLEANIPSRVDPNNPLYQFSYFYCDKDTIFRRIGQCSASWQQELYRNGGVVYLDAVMTVCDRGRPLGCLLLEGDSYSGEVYFGYEGIAYARSWADREALGTHFDKILSFPALPAMVLSPALCTIEHYEIRDSAGTQLWSMRRFGKDSTGTLVVGSVCDYGRQDFSAQHFNYQYANVHVEWTDGGMTDYQTQEVVIHIDNTAGAIRRVDIDFCYLRTEVRVQRRHQYNCSALRQLVTGKACFGHNLPGGEQFDTEYGIPSGEKIYACGEADSFSYSFLYEKVQGMETFLVNVISAYCLQWTDETGFHEEHTSITEMYFIDRSYSYWTIKEASVFCFQKAVMNNGAIADRSCLAFAERLPVVTVLQREQHKFIPAFDTVCHVQETVLQGNGARPQVPIGIRGGEASNHVGSIQVENDLFSVDSTVYLSGDRRIEETAEPVCETRKLRTAFYADNILIPETVQNRDSYISSLQLIYRNPLSGTTTTAQSSDIEEIAVHTPVVCSLDIPNRKEFNQMRMPREELPTLILGMEFDIYPDYFGQHRDIPGYGRRDYSKYVKNCFVRFPFEVYDGDEYVPAFAWTEYNGMQSFYLPTGVEEGEYEINFMVCAKNVPDSFPPIGEQQIFGKYGEIANDERERIGEGANCRFSQSAAVCSAPVYVTGRLFGFEITDVLDEVRWKSVFHKENLESTGVVYRVGGRDENGRLLVGEKYRQAPMLRGSNPNEPKDEGVRLGYPFGFRCRTIGNALTEEDSLQIKADFYCIDKEGTNRRAVDVYAFVYDREEKKNVFVNLERTAEFGTMKLSHSQTHSVGQCSRNVANAMRAIRSVTQWEGQYYVPGEIFVVPEGEDLEEYIRRKGDISYTDSIFMKGKYLLVHFEMNTIRTGEAILSYRNAENHAAGYADMWKLEGFFTPHYNSDRTAFEIEEGDIFLYDMDKTFHDDYPVYGTH